MTGDKRTTTPFLRDRVGWLVGFRYRCDSRTVRCFYLVCDAVTGRQAQQLAAARACSTAEMQRRGHRPLDAEWVQIQRLRRDGIGAWHLAGV
ncbi:hypothetical protein [Streptomyces sp. NPDC059909]|uniref:hypothetical protein n=1 Tax=Streptomyces sp. NPDC059909 TaxID=3346998 RepID=UPI003646AD5E